jgi:hypothetical protein
MASMYLADMKLLERDVDSVDTALHAYEKDMLAARKGKQHGHYVANDVAPDSLRYLFGIFN